MAFRKLKKITTKLDTPVISIVSTHRVRIKNCFGVFDIIKKSKQNANSKSNLYADVNGEL